jgi:hypothetical protein
MAYMGSGVFPVLPGKADRVRNFEQELAPHRAEFERLCREAGGYRHWNLTLQEGPGGDWAIYSFVFDDPSTVRTRFTDSPHDKWWTDFVRDVHGVDMTVGEAVAPPSVFTWERPQAG